MFREDESLMNNSDKSNINAMTQGNTSSESNSYDIYNYANVFFTTEKINLPRGRVIKQKSCGSSPSHGFVEPADEELIDY